MAKFQKGKSGNPGGRPKALRQVEELAREQTAAAMQTLATIHMGGIDHHDNPHLGTAALMHSSLRGSEQTMTDEQLAAMHRLLANYHRKLATEAVLDVVQQYHADLAQRLAPRIDHASGIPRTTKSRR
jgi:hypothetical protein